MKQQFNFSSLIASHLNQQIYNTGNEPHTIPSTELLMAGRIYKSIFYFYLVW